MINGLRVVVVMPAFNAEVTLLRTIAEVDRRVVDHIVVVDDASQDRTAVVAVQAGVEVYRHPKNLGYGGNQKSCYQLAIDGGGRMCICCFASPFHPCPFAR